MLTSKNSLTAVILAGGPGTRLQPHTDNTPKPMVPVLNKPFLEHTVNYLKKYNIQSIIATLNYLPEVVQNYFGDGTRHGIMLNYCLETSPMGTAGAVKNAEQFLDSSFIVLNGDIFNTDLDIADMLAFHRRQGAKATIALKWVENPSAYGVVEVNGEGRITRFIEKPSPEQITTNWINAGTYILEPEVLKHVPANQHYMFEKGLFPLLLELGEPLYGYYFNGYWLDMGTEEKYLSLNHDLLSVKVNSPLFPLIEKDAVSCEEDVIIHPDAKVVAPVLIGSNSRISQGAYIKGPAVIGPDCYVGKDAVVERAVIWQGIHINDNAVCQDMVISNNSQLAGAGGTPDTGGRTPNLKSDRAWKRSINDDE